MPFAILIGVGASVIAFLITSAVTLGQTEHGVQMGFVFGIIGFLLTKDNPQRTNYWIDQSIGRIPVIRKPLEFIRAKQQEKKRLGLITDLKTLKQEQIELLGEFDPASVPDDLEQMELKDLEEVVASSDTQHASQQVTQTKKRMALEERLEAIDEMFADETRILSFTSGEYLRHFPKLEKHIRSKINDFINQHTQSSGINMSNGFTAGMSIVTSGISAAQTEGARGDMNIGMHTVQYGRALQDIRGGERALLRSFYLLDAYGEITQLALFELKASIIFNDGTHLRQSRQGTASHKKHIGNGQHFAHEAIAPHIGSNTANLQQAIARLRSLENSDDPIIAQLVQASFESGNSWATAKDIYNSQVYKPYEEGSADLLLGWYEDELPVGFGGFESLVTIARPGTGKTQSQVIPNMLTYPGSIIALDVKGELYETTAETRAEKFGKVIKLDLRDVALSQRYNPLAHIGRDKAWTAARPVANLLFAAGSQQSDGSKGGYFRGRARDMVQAFIAYQLITGETPTLTTVLDMLSPTSSEFEEYVKVMGVSGNRGLERYANTLADMPEDQLQGVFDTARNALSIFEDEDIEALTNENDWNPSDLLEPGTSLYLCVPEGGIASYAPLLRLIIGQHLDMFDAPELGRPELPLTCFLDELPQLGFCEPIDKATELGRGRGVRLWMFAQDHEQITKTYGQGIIDRCAVEMYMKPADKTAQHLSSILGETEDIFTGEKKPLAPVHDLLGERFSARVVVKATGAKPVHLEKKFAFHHQTKNDTLMR